MTTTHAVLLLLVSHAAIFGAGWYGHYRWGAKLAALESKVKAAV